MLHPLYPVTGYYFVKNSVLYSSYVKKYGARFVSMHNREGLDEEQAKKLFHEEHQKTVRSLIREKLVNDEKKKTNGKIILQS